VIKGSKKLGDMIVERIASGDELRYNINSSVTFKILFSFTVDFKCYANYQNGVLVKEYTLNELNGRVQNESELNKTTFGYELVSSGVSTQVKDPIDYSIAAIYYQEPFDGQEVFSPAFGQFLKFKQIGHGKYEMISPDGQNIYHYENGLCTRVDVARGFCKIFI